MSGNCLGTFLHPDAPCDCNRFTLTKSFPPDQEVPPHQALEGPQPASLSQPSHHLHPSGRHELSQPLPSFQATQRSGFESEEFKQPEFGGFNIREHTSVPTNPLSIRPRQPSSTPGPRNFRHDPINGRSRLTQPETSSVRSGQPVRRINPENLNSGPGSINASYSGCFQNHPPGLCDCVPGQGVVYVPMTLAPAVQQQPQRHDPPSTHPAAPRQGLPQSDLFYTPQQALDNQSGPPANLPLNFGSELSPGYGHSPSTFTPSVNSATPQHYSQSGSAESRESASTTPYSSFTNFSPAGFTPFVARENPAAGSFAQQFNTNRGEHYVQQLVVKPQSDPVTENTQALFDGDNNKHPTPRESEFDRERRKLLNSRTAHNIQSRLVERRNDNILSKKGYAVQCPLMWPKSIQNDPQACGYFFVKPEEGRKHFKAHMFKHFPTPVPTQEAEIRKLSLTVFYPEDKVSHMTWAKFEERYNNDTIKLYNTDAPETSHAAETSLAHRKRRRHLAVEVPDFGSSPSDLDEVGIQSGSDSDY